MDSKSKKKKSKQTNKDIVVLDKDKHVVDWMNVLDDLVQSNISDKPKVIYEKYCTVITKDYNVSMDDMPQEKIVKNKINAIRQKHKKKAIGGVV